MSTQQGRRPNDNRRPQYVYRVGAEPDPRFSLANERTLLAWLRTSLALVVTGVAAVALEHVVRSRGLVVLVATSACGMGSILATAAYVRWLQVERAMRLHRPLPAPHIAAVLVIVLVVLAGAGVVTAIVLL